MQLSTTENSAKIKEFTTTLLRKIRTIEYKNVSLVPGYERTEEEYLCLRNSLNSANLMIKDLMCYEHGNRLFKIVKDGLQVLSDKSSLNVYKSKDVFEDLSSIAKKMSMMNLDSEGRSTAFKFSNAYRRISESKKSLNSKLENIRLQLKEKRSQSLDIDRDRKRVKNMRFDLEVLLQDEGYNGEIRDVEKKEFSAFSSKVLKKMIQFVEDASLSHTLRGVAKEYSKYLKETSEILKNME